MVCSYKSLEETKIYRASQTKQNDRIETKNKWVFYGALNNAICFNVFSFVSSSKCMFFYTVSVAVVLSQMKSAAFSVQIHQPALHITCTHITKKTTDNFLLRLSDGVFCCVVYFRIQSLIFYRDCGLFNMEPIAFSIAFGCKEVSCRFRVLFSLQLYLSVHHFTSM